jgi:hypothetical protein
MKTVERSILEHQLGIDFFHSADPKCVGIARRAVEHGYSSLSDLQKHVLKPFLSLRCDGYAEPGGHSSCNVVLEGKQLLEAYEQADFLSGSLQCASCKCEADSIAYRKEKAFRDD